MRRPRQALQDPDSAYNALTTPLGVRSLPRPKSSKPILAACGARTRGRNRRARNKTSPREGRFRRRRTNTRCAAAYGASRQELFRFSVLSCGQVISIAVYIDRKSNEHLLDKKHDANTPVAWIPPSRAAGTMQTFAYARHKPSTESLRLLQSTV